jgi:putative DNA primase/helicase
MNSLNVCSWALRYINLFERHHQTSAKLTYMPHGTKAPKHARWNCDDQLLSTPRQVRDHFAQPAHVADNIGIVLEPSGVVSLDADDPDATRVILAAEGIDLDRLIDDGPTIIGRAPRLEYLAPKGIELSRKKIIWPQRPHEQSATRLELRAGRVHDVLPPSMHPDTRRPYGWNPPPRTGFRELPDELLRLWLDFDRFAHRARNLCPWAPPEPEPVQHVHSTQPYTGPSVIRAFNDAHSVVAILEAHKYQKTSARRWKSPNGHGVAGVVLLGDGRVVYCHHGSDPLGDGRAHDAFDLFRIFEYGGDTRRAVKAAAELLGLDRERQA